MGQATNQRKLNYHKADVVRMKNLFNEVNRTELLANKTNNEKWNLFLETYRKFINSCVPFYRSESAYTKPKWMNRRILTTI